VSPSTKLTALSRLLSDPDAGASEELAGAALGLACELVPGARWASLTYKTTRPRTTAVSDPRAAALDELQYRTGGGPCLTALETTTVVVSDFATENRWPSFTALAVAEGTATGSVSYPLAPAGHEATSLNLYTDRAESVSGMDVEAAAYAASVIALVLTAINQRDQLRNLDIALKTSRSIGAAIGILMHRHRWTYDQAFDAMRHVSQRTHRRLRDIAADVMLIGDLPD
jgi:hypothetical protein